MNEVISQEIIENFLHGENPEKYIVAIHYDYATNTIHKVIQDPEKGKIIKTDKLIAFLWCNSLVEMNFYNSNKSLQKKNMGELGIVIEKLETRGNERLNGGHKFLIKSLKGYGALINFFKRGGIDPWGDKYKKHFTVLTPVEQYMIHNKIRLFKGIEEYDDIHRLVFDIETTGLKPENSRIILIGLKDNRGFSKTISAFGENGEEMAIIEFFETIKKINPTIIGGYNSASFDFPFILKRADILGLDIKKLSDVYNGNYIKEKERSLKLANEVESYNQFELFGFNIIDISHAVRRAQAIDSEIKSWGLKYITKFIDKQKPNRVYVEGSKISKIYLENKSYYVNPKTGNYREIGTPGTENLLDRFPNVYEIWNGERIVEQYLDDDLYETMVVDDSFSQSTFLLSKLVPTTYERAATMGTATLWKLIMLAWSYDNKLAIPSKIPKRKFTGGLSRLLNVGYSKNVVKFDFASLYPSIQLVYDVFPECDVMGVQKSMLKYFRNIRIKYKRLVGEYKETNPSLSEMYDRKQLPIKIFINGYFGSLSAPQVFPWSEMDKGETITCIGRQCLRMMIMFFIRKGYKPLVMDTDGVNFETPEDLNEHRYIGKGLNELVTEGKEYAGIEADTAEFNDIFMRNEMGLDIDYISPATINISKKNYIVKLIKKGKEKIKLTGNTIKSKVLQQYIADFLNDGLKHLLNGDGQSFLELYYEYVDKIYNKKIPLAKIANKSKMKQTIDEYNVYITKRTKAGNLMARQAHMELVKRENNPANLGEVVYYINNGVKKNDGDVIRKSKWTKKEKKEYLEKHGIEMPNNHEEIIINCYLISEKDLVENPDMTGEYNVARYMEAFNKRIEPLLVVFKPEIRDDIIIDNPNDRKYFTKTQLELINGHPIKEGNQDKFEEVMTLSDTEVDFWNRMDMDPYFIYFEDSIEEIDEYWVEHNRQVLHDKKMSVQNNEDELLGVTDENDDAILHANYV